ncbi:acyl-CoA dehydrogenase C-terminal domain-containing protein [Pseudokordiimonas caeni]|uniref:acyl-CoA dehydrogenase C-terminal domain-containing protein n=1 Tax=Pseudokordiimonas caeni TaxID=2997908 RepID=UPI002810FF70|nr:acyl-CoA dehydrogenase C-terminal domain-containing protein [Pseudokordiimonas caeni]
MSDYRAPLEEITFALETVGGLRDWDSLPGFEEAGEDIALAVLEECGKMASEVIAPTNRTGDTEGAKLTSDGVVTPAAFKPVFEAYREGGWNTLASDPDFGGQGLPATLAIAVTEMITSANMAFSLCPLLTAGAIEAIAAHGSDEIKAKYLPKMVSFEWTGAMNLTEPSAGSDVGALKAKAEKQADGTYLIKGQKIFITWGDHDQAENVVHLVLARLPGAPEGTRGISMFLVPKYMVNEDGSLGARNDVRVVSLEHKLGIHSSPTCVMSFGDHDACIGYIVGEENKGMRNMFTMMNHARIGVGLEGVAVAERAYQHAVAYARDRVQSAAIGAKSRDSVTIIHHPDVRRLLLTSRALTEAARAIIYRNVWAVDRAHHAADVETRRLAQGEADLLTPISKAWSTDIGVEVSSLALQVFGGMGFIEETGAAQFYRDSRIAPIYEGTNGIQALDLVGRKLNADGGEHWHALIAEMRSFVGGLDRAMAGSKTTLGEGVDALANAAETLFANGFEGIVDTAGAATPYLKLFGTVLGGYLLARQAVAAERRLASGDGNPGFLKAKITTATFFIEQLLPPAIALLGPIKAGATQLMAMDEADFARG